MDWKQKQLCLQILVSRPCFEATFEHVTAALHTALRSGIPYQMADS